MIRSSNERPGERLQRSYLAGRRGGPSHKLQTAAAEERRKHPGAMVEVWAMDEHRIGLKPITRGVWAPIGEQPIALGHHRFEWLYVTGSSSRRDVTGFVER